MHDLASKEYAALCADENKIAEHIYGNVARGDIAQRDRLIDEGLSVHSLPETSRAIIEIKAQRLYEAQEGKTNERFN